MRGAAMMRGYWGQPDAEADCFWHRPSPGGHPDRFYRSLAADSVRQLSAYVPLTGRLLLDVGGGPGYIA